MALPTLVQLGVIAVLFAFGFAAEHSLPAGRTWTALPPLGKMLVSGGAVGSILVITRWDFTVAGFDETVVAVAVMILIYVVVPAVLPGPRQSEPSTTC